MTQFRSKQDGSHYPLKKGHVHKFNKPTYPGVWECRCGAEKTMDEFKDKRNLYGGQYRMSQELADVLNKHMEFGVGGSGSHHAHNMTAFVDRNHFDVSAILIDEGIYREKLLRINKEANEGNPKLWNTIREDLLCDGVVKLGEKYGVSLERPWGINAKGDITIIVTQENPQIRRMMHE